MKDQSKMNNATINIETERELARQLLLRCSQRDNNPALYGKLFLFLELLNN